MIGRSICVFCASSTAIPSRYVALAEEVGAGIAQRGMRLISGGENVSMMGAVVRAARAHGGMTVGVVPEVLLHRADQDSGELRVTPDLRSRKATMAESADAFLALPGGIGTCEELFEAWMARVLALHTKPVVILDPDGHYAGLFGWLEDLRHRGFIAASTLGAVMRAGTASEALDACTALRPSGQTLA